MISSRSRLASLAAAAAILVGACSAGATPTPAPTQAPTPAPTAAASASAAAPTATPLTVPADQLIKAGTLTVCSDTSYPPQEYLDNNQPVGSDLDLAAEIAKRLGLQVAIKSTVFDTIIPALTGGSCDIIVSAQTITDSRKQQVDMVPYFAAGQAWVVLTGNPSNINAITDLCGKAVAAEKGTVEADHVAGTGDYKPEDSLNAQCKTAGKANITLKVFDKDTDALLALQAGTVVAHFTDEPVAGYEVAKGNGAFQLAPAAMTLEHSPEGISVTKNHTALRDAVKAALLAMIADGTYTKILTKWGVQSGAITAADVNS